MANILQLILEDTHTRTLGCLPNAQLKPVIAPTMLEP